MLFSGVSYRWQLKANRSSGLHVYRYMCFLLLLTRDACPMLEIDWYVQQRQGRVCVSALNACWWTRHQVPNNHDLWFMCFVFVIECSIRYSLVSADTVIIYDSDWNPQSDLQAQVRILSSCHSSSSLLLLLLLLIVFVNIGSSTSNRSNATCRRISTDHFGFVREQTGKDHLDVDVLRFCVC